MNKDQVKDRESEEKGKAKEVAGKVANDESTEHKGNAEKHVGKDGAVLKDINIHSRKETK